MAFDLVAQVLWCPEYAYSYFRGMQLNVVQQIPICPPLSWYRHEKKLELNCKNVPEKFSSTKCFNIGINHGFQCSNIRWITRKVFEHKAAGRVFKHLPSDPANV